MPFHASARERERESRFAPRADSLLKAFTLIELLVVIAIIAILAVVVIFTLNPPQLLAQSRDANRISDMSTLNSALGFYLAQGGNSLGNANTVYVSIPDPTATSTLGDQCQGLGLVSLPSGYTYQCPASSTYKLTNGSGWIPVNFSSISIGSPLSILPVDPTNTTSSRLYYTYTTNGSQYEVTSVMESAKYQIGGSNDVIGNDGGTLTSVYEKGSKLGLEPLDYGDTGLVGYWSFEEGSSSVAYDYSGNNATGSWNGTATGTNGYYSPGKIGRWAGYFNAASNPNTNMVNVSDSPNFEMGSSQSFTLAAWGDLSSSAPSSSANTFIGKRNGAVWYQLRLSGGNYVPTLNLNDGANSISLSSSTNLSGNWHYVVGVVNRGNALASLYVDGTLIATASISSIGDLTLAGVPVCIGDFGGNCTPGSNSVQPWLGLIDDVRIYNRALSAAEIAAMYAGGK